MDHDELFALTPLLHGFVRILRIQEGMRLRRHHVQREADILRRFSAVGLERGDVVGDPIDEAARLHLGVPRPPNFHDEVSVGGRTRREFALSGSGLEISLRMRCTDIGHPNVEALVAVPLQDIERNAFQCG